jgi:HEAT repeat protein
MAEPTLEDFIAQLQSPMPSVRRNAAWLLGRFRDARMVAPLIARLQDDDALVRARAAESLASRREPAVMTALLECLLDEHPDVRRMALRSLGFIANPSSLPALIRVLQDDDASVRSQVAESLGIIAQDEDIPRDALAPAVAPLMQAFIHDVDSNVRHYASISLQNIASADVHQTLVASLASLDDIPTILDILELMGKIASPTFRDTLTTYSQHDQDDIVALAQWALARLPKESE